MVLRPMPSDLLPIPLGRAISSSTSDPKRPAAARADRQRAGVPHSRLYTIGKKSPHIIISKFPKYVRLGRSKLSAFYQYLVKRQTQGHSPGSTEPGRSEDAFSAPSENPSYQAHAFIRQGKLDLLRDFLDKSPDSVHTPSFSGTFLAVVIGCNNVEATQILLDTGASPLETTVSTLGWNLRQPMVTGTSGDFYWVDSRQ